MSRLLVVVTAVLAGQASCDRRTEPPTESHAPASTAVPVPLAASSASVPATAPLPAAAPAGSSSLHWPDPPGWRKVPPSSPARKATYEIPAVAPDGENAEMAIFYFGGEGGATEANIQRWISQFSGVKPADVKRTQRKLGALSATIVQIEGTYASGMPGGPLTPRAGYELIGAVVETPAGPYFFKLTGPKRTVDAASGAYMGMLDGVTPGS